MKPPTPHQLPEALRKLLPKSTARGWLGIAPALPNGAVLYGGTGITAHLLHRVSRDLDFYTSVAFDPDRLAKTLANHGSFVTTQIDGGTLNGIFEDTKVRFLDASGQMAFERTTTMGGISVAGMRHGLRASDCGAAEDCSHSGQAGRARCRHSL